MAAAARSGRRLGLCHASAVAAAAVAAPLPPPPYRRRGTGRFFCFCVWLCVACAGGDGAGGPARCPRFVFCLSRNISLASFGSPASHCQRRGMDGLTWQAVGVGVWDGSGEEVGVLEEVTTATPPPPPPSILCHHCPRRRAQQHRRLASGGRISHVANSTGARQFKNRRFLQERTGAHGWRRP